MNIQNIGNSNLHLNQIAKMHGKDGVHVAQATELKKVDFGNILNKAITEISDLQKISSQYDEMLITGKIDNLHEPLIAAKKAEILFSFGLEVRAQILDAYRELMRIQL